MSICRISALRADFLWRNWTWSFFDYCGHFLTTVVNFLFRTFWADLILLCVKMCRFFWAEIPGKRVDIPGKRAEIPGQIQHDWKMKTWSGQFVLEMVIVILKWTHLLKNGQKTSQNLPGQKFVTNEYPHMTRWPGSLCTRRFRKPTHRPLEPQNIRKKHGTTQSLAIFLLFCGPWHLALLSTDSFSSDSFSSLTALTTVAASVHKSEVWLRNFLWPYNI